MIVAFIIITFSPARFGFGPRNFDDTTWLEDDLDENSFLASTIRQRRKEEAAKAMSHLTVGAFSTVASTMVKEGEDAAACVICQA